MVKLLPGWIVEDENVLVTVPALAVKGDVEGVVKGVIIGTESIGVSTHPLSNIVNNTRNIIPIFISGYTFQKRTPLLPINITFIPNDI